MQQPFSYSNKIFGANILMMSKDGEDDEPDYMSDEFLAKCIPTDVRPGLKRVSSIFI